MNTVSNNGAAQMKAQGDSSEAGQREPGSKGFLSLESRILETFVIFCYKIATSTRHSSFFALGQLFEQ